MASKRNPVVSNSIKAVGYHEETSTLEVEFRNGRRYRYADVSKAHYFRFLNADSPGDFFHKNVKGRFKHVEVDPRKESQAAEEEPTASPSESWRSGAAGQGEEPTG